LNLCGEQGLLDTNGGIIVVCDRVICLNCMDGRVQLPVIEWIKGDSKAKYVDMVTEPGMDGILADMDRPVKQITDKIRFSIDRNNASAVFIVGHHDCRGNPVEGSVHNVQIIAGVKRLKAEFPNMPVHGLWVDRAWQVSRLT